LYLVQFRATVVAPRQQCRTETAFRRHQVFDNSGDWVRRERRALKGEVVPVDRSSASGAVAGRVLQLLTEGLPSVGGVSVQPGAAKQTRHWNWSSAVRAHGGCLGAGRRGRTRQAAKSHGEEHASCDPWISEWGNPAGGKTRHLLGGANAGN
jgi:hypothetical protein